MAHWNTLFGKQSCAIKLALTWSVMHSLNKVKSSQLWTINTRAIRENMKTIYLGLAAYRLIFTEEKKKENSHCIDIISGVVMQELKKGRGNQGDEGD